MREQIQASLESISGVPWIDVAFLIDNDGRLLAHAGSSPAFDPNVGFDSRVADPSMTEPDTSLYLTSITDGVYLGVLFPAGVPIEQVRAEIKSRESSVASSLSS
ncbi:MAG: hypothetical protein KC561_03945 [Myxococcales bacterium]|nr:hypothetical protein [Myxococcales bacterium]